MSVSKEFLDKMYRRLGEARSSLAHHKAVKDFPGDGYSEKVHAAETHLRNAPCWPSIAASETTSTLTAAPPQPRKSHDREQRRP